MNKPEINVEENSKRSIRQLKRAELELNAADFAGKFWKLLVEKVGDRTAKQIMRHVMGEKKPGRPRTDYDFAMIIFLYGYIRHFGLKMTDGRLAKYIFQTKPQYVRLESGAVVVSNNRDFSANPGFDDDPIVARSLTNMSYSAIKKKMEWLRRWAIKEEFLPENYAPRRYRRD